MFCILTKSGNLFSDLEKMAMFVAALAHDVDHRAYSNQFLQKTKHPLSRLYPTSTMEHHHLETALSIFKAPNCDILHCFHDDPSSLSKALEVIRTSVLATDLAYYFTNRVKIVEGFVKKSFDIKTPEWR